MCLAKSRIASTIIKQGRPTMTRFASGTVTILALLIAGQLHADPIVSALPAESVVSEGDTFAIDIVVSGVPEFDAVSSFDLTLAFDDSILALTDVLFGTALGDADAFEVTEDALYPFGGDPGLVNASAISFLAFELFDLQPSGADVLLFTLLFEGLAAGTSAISFVPDTVLLEPGIIIKDFFGFAFADGDIRANGARVTVEERAVAVPEPGTLLLLLLGLAVVVVRGGHRHRTLVRSGRFQQGASLAN